MFSYIGKKNAPEGEVLFLADSDVLTVERVGERDRNLALALRKLSSTVFKL